jgi:hypothetical protein
VLAADVAASLRQSWQIVLVAVFVAITGLYMAVYQRGSAKMSTADHIRQIKKALEIYEGQFGGYPRDLNGLGQRFGPLPTHVYKDAWDHEIRYSASKLLGSPRETGEPIFAECELRSAGPNGDLGDDDDIVWNGMAGGR